MIRHIPPKETLRWTGPYLGNYYGTLWKTFNVDLDRNDGKILLSPRMVLIETNPELDSRGNVVAFTRTDADCTDRYWALLDTTGLYKTDSESAPSPVTDWDSDGLDSSPTDPLDWTVHGNDSRNDSGRNKLFVTRDTGDISVLNDSGNNAWTGNWWVTKQAQPRLDTSIPFHPIEYFPFRKISLIGDGNLIHTISRPSDTQNDTVSYARLVLPKELVSRHIFTTTNRAWILCYNKIGGTGAVVEWDGFSQTYNDIHSIYSSAPTFGINYQENPLIINNLGIILEFTGSGFKPMIRGGQQIAFPFSENRQISLSTTSGVTMTFSTSPRGIIVGEDGLIYINMTQGSTTYSRYGGGIWCLNPVTGRLYNKICLSGDSNDYGYQNVNQAGGLYWVPSNVVTRNLLAGAIIDNTVTTTQTGIWISDLQNSSSSGQTRGYFITQYILSEEIKEFWDNLYVRFRRFVSSSSSIVVKAKGVRSITAGQNNSPVLLTITWVNATSFTLTSTSIDDALAVGDEVEIKSGPNAGALAHITIISGAHGGAQTITIDETLTASTSTGRAVFERWKKIGTITSNSIYEQQLSVGIDSSFIQFKIELRGLATEMEFSDLVATSKPSIKLEN